MTVEARSQQHHHQSPVGAGLPLMKELTALSRTRSLRDPSTSSVLRSPLLKGTTTPGGGTPASLRGKPVKDSRSEDSKATCKTPSLTEVEVRRARGERLLDDDGEGDDLPTSGNSTKPHIRRGARKLQSQEKPPVKPPSVAAVAAAAAASGSLSRKIVSQLQMIQQQGMQGMYEDPGRVRIEANDSPSENEGSGEEEHEPPQPQQRHEHKVGARSRSRSQSPLLSRDIPPKIRSPNLVSREIIRSTRGFVFPDPGSQQFNEEEDELECVEEPRHGCGIPWNWSRLGQQKQKAKSFLDIAGRSLSCGHPDGSSTRKKSGDQVELSRSQSGSGRDLVFPPDCLSYSSAGNSDAEILPLLTEPEASVSGDMAAAAASSVEMESDNNDNLNNKLARRTRRVSRSQMASEILHARLKERIGWINSTLSVPPHQSRHQQQHSNRSLSFRYRPRSFREIVGQNVVTQSLSNAVLRGRIAPVYLFQGPPGSGKSSAARVFGAALNCLSSEELRPCGLCRECVVLNLSKSSDIREFDASRLGGSDSVKQLMEQLLIPPSSGRFRVSILDECHALSSSSWSTFFRAMEDPPGHSIIVLITTNPEKLPRNLAARCQKFQFAKIREADIVSRIQKLASKERVEIEIEALELIASRSNGSLRDAEAMLEQLGLLGQPVTLSTVQELAGLLPDEKLMELLDSALSGDTVNTVRSVRNLLESGVEPLALMSQVATLITDLLAGSHKLGGESQRKRRFFHRNTLSKEDLERLRQALKILLEAEKQVRASSDQTTWLTAAILQFAPDRAYIFPASSSRSSGSLAAGSDTSDKDTIESEPKQGWEQEQEQFETQQGNETAVFSNTEVVPVVSSSWAPPNTTGKSLATVQEARIHPSIEGHESFTFDRKKLNEVWQKALKNSRSKSVKHLLRAHGKLISLTMQEVHATAEIEFQHPKRRAKAEKLKTRISHTFQSVLGFPVEIQLSVASKLPVEHEKRRVPIYPLCGDSLHRRGRKGEEASSPPRRSTEQLCKAIQRTGVTEELRLESAWAREAASQQHTPSAAGASEGEKHWKLGGDSSSSSRVPLSLVMQQQQQQQQQPAVDQLRHQQFEHQDDPQFDLTGPLRFRRVRHLGPEVTTNPTRSEFEHANLRLECRTKPSRRILCCWRTHRGAPGGDEERKAKQRRRRRRRACFFLRLVPCAQACTR